MVPDTVDGCILPVAPCEEVDVVPPCRQVFGKVGAAGASPPTLNPEERPQQKNAILYVSIDCHPLLIVDRSSLRSDMPEIARLYRR